MAESFVLNKADECGLLGGEKEKKGRMSSSSYL